MAERERRTVSGYVLNIVLRSVGVEERFFARVIRLGPLPFSRPAGPRTCLLIRCSEEEAKRIRQVAKRRQMTMCGYVLYCLERWWNVGRAEPPHFAPQTPPAGKIAS
jgi:hypothetical protein